MVMEKVKQLDEAHARQLLIWLHGQEDAVAPARQPAGRGPGRHGHGSGRRTPANRHG